MNMSVCGTQKSNSKMPTFGRSTRYGGRNKESKYWHVSTLDITIWYLVHNNGVMWYEICTHVIFVLI